MGKPDSLQYGAILAIKGSGGSHKTRYNHLREALNFCRTLRNAGFGVQKWENLTGKHVAAVVGLWRSKGLAVSTIKEYLSGVRVALRFYGNDRVASANAAFGIGNRTYVTNIDKSVPQPAFEQAIQSLRNSDQADHHRVAAQLLLQRYLGLRREESYKFSPTHAVLKDNRIFITDGTKGGRDRIIQEPGEKAWSAVAYARSVLLGRNTMSQMMSERQWSNFYYRTIRAVGLSKEQVGASSHGLRHAYAHERYRQLAGFEPPAKFGSKAEFRTNAERVAGESWRAFDSQARTILKGELGHGPDRDDVVSVYVGSC
jgi:site-specific recombinase XerD